jgi:hypothetical protein
MAKAWQAAAVAVRGLNNDWRSGSVQE